MRKEMHTEKQVIAQLEKEILKTMKVIKKESVENHKMVNDAKERKNEILALKVRHETEKQEFENKMKSLKQELEKTDMTSRQLKRSQMNNDGLSKLEEGDNAEEFHNPADLLRQRLHKWQQNNIAKKELMDKYIRNVKVVEDAFEQIKEQTGIDTIDEIVATFIKAEEQNYLLYNYVNELNSEIDIVEEQNKQISQEIEEHEKRMKMTEAEKGELIKQKKNDLEVGRFELDKKEQEIKQKMENLGQIQGYVEKMISLFTNSSFPIQVAQPMHYDEDTQFTEKNASQYLAELEEYISQLIISLAYKNEKPNAAFSDIPFEKLDTKQFLTKKEQQKKYKEIFSALDDQKGHTSLPQEDQEENATKYVTSGKELYQRVLDSVNKGGVSSILSNTMH